MDSQEWVELMLRLSVGLMMIAFGLHQMWRPDKWLEYIPRWLGRVLPVSALSFMASHGFGNFVLGTALALGVWQPVILWIVLVWWLSLLPFVFYVNWRNGFRDIVAIAAVISLIVLHG